MPDSSPAALRDTCRDYLTSHRAALVEAIAAGQRGLTVAERWARMFDGLLGSLCCAAEAEMRGASDQPLGRLALVAVGGYGRRLVAPHSDIDVLFLCEDPSDPRLLQLAESVLYPLWDVGVDIGHAIRGLDETLELSETDIRTATTLLDVRPIAGERTIVQELISRGRDRIFTPNMIERFLEALETDTQARHERFGDSLYLREPELKMGRGGLRDLDVISWSARARFQSESLEQVVPHGMLTVHEASELLAAQEHLWTVRNHLHLMASRRRDRLTFDDQETIASALGYRDGLNLAVEEMMQGHYRHARAIARVVDRIGDRVRRSLRRPPTTVRDLGSGVLVHDGRVTFKQTVLTHPPDAFRLYSFVCREGLPPDPEARDVISGHTTDRDWARRLRRSDEAATFFSQLLTRAELAPVRRGSLLEEMHEVGLLNAMIPELEAVTGRVRHDAYHTYTVDTQAIMAVDKLRQLERGELAAEFLMASRLAAEMPRSLPLSLALLLHGLGTGHPDDPARHAAAIAAAVAERLGLAPSDVAHTQWLIANQTSMYHWAVRRDITDPVTIAEVAREVGTVHRLNDLYLFTFCSVSTANPAAMTAWNARMLQELWRSVADLLEGRGGASEHVERVRAQLAEKVNDPQERALLDEFVAQISERYLLATSARRIREHAKVAMHRGTGLGLAAIPSSISERTLEIVIAVDDRPGLLADLTAALAACRFSVDSAELYTRKRPGLVDEAFDVFLVTHPSIGSGDLDLMSDEVAKLRSNIEDVFSGKALSRDLLERRSRPPPWQRVGPHIKTEIHVDNASSNRFTIVDVYTRDRPDLLHTIARTVHEKGLTIALAKVNTEGQRVADVFYVQTPSGQKLGGPGQLAELSAALRDVIRAMD
jgi:[protein-PII] uridylyltransferase